MSIIILSPPPPPPPGGRVADDVTPDSVLPMTDGQVIAVFEGPNAVRRARKYLKALEE